MSQKNGDAESKEETIRTTTNNKYFFNEYGYMPTVGFYTREKQAKDQGIEDNLCLTFGEGYHACTDSPTPPTPPTPVTVNVSSNSPVCVGGENLTLTCETVDGATAYEWTGPNAFSASSQNVDVHVTKPAEESGEYRCTVTVGGETYYGSTEVTIYPGVGNLDGCVTWPASPVSVGDECVFEVSGVGSVPHGFFLNYNWDFGDGTTYIGSTASHTYDKTGSYTAKLTVYPAKCSDDCKCSVEAKQDIKVS